MLTVDNRQLQYRLDKLEADYRQESEKVKTHFKKKGRQKNGEAHVHQKQSEQCLKLGAID